MNSDFLHTPKLRTASIQQVNDALIVLRHFVELNYRLLPMLNSLYAKISPTDKDLADIHKIKTVFDSYHFDINASVVLMDSPILELIRKSYSSITQNDGLMHASKNLYDFEKEFKRLQSNWNGIRNN